MSPLALALLGAAHAGPALDLTDDYLRWDHTAPAAPPAGTDAWHVVDLGTLVVVRLPPDAMGDGFDHAAFTRAIQEATADRGSTYDLAILTHSADLPTQFTGAAAFHLAFNTGDQWGTGREAVLTPDVPVRAGLWMNHADYWDEWPDDVPDWVFCHELGHYWLAFPALPEGTDDSLALLGRQRAHWSWFLSTGNSPMEGNAWVDNGDGTWTTDLDAGGAFGALDLYMLGLLAAEDVAPLTLLEPVDAIDRNRESSPEHLFQDEPATIAAHATSWSVEHIVQANGDRAASEGLTGAGVQALPVLVLGPEEPITDALLARTADNIAGWEAAWGTCTGGLGALDIAAEDEGWDLPAAASTPTLIPREAW